MSYFHRAEHDALLDRFGQALAIYDRWPTKANRELVDAAHLDVIDSSLGWNRSGNLSRKGIRAL